MKRTPLKRKSKTEVAKLIQKLVKVSHDYIRNRDSLSKDTVGGACFDCGKITYGKNFQAGHFIPDSSGGALLRYHPHNMHGQASGCNMSFVQERVKINYTLAMIRMYGQERLNEIMRLKTKTVKADSIFYSKLIELYQIGREEDIVNFLENEKSG